MIDPEIANAWSVAAIDLGIRVLSPVTVPTNSDQILQFEAHILDFGSPSGAIAMSEISRADKTIARVGLWSSVLSSSYRIYERQLFIDTLDDWGWYGEKENAPTWYTGKPWC